MQFLLKTARECFLAVQGMTVMDMNAWCSAHVDGANQYGNAPLMEYASIVASLMFFKSLPDVVDRRAAARVARVLGNVVRGPVEGAIHRAHLRMPPEDRAIALAINFAIGLEAANQGRMA